MRLVQLRLNGFRRFGEARLDLDSPLVAIVGPNEAGKSTLLDAVAIGLEGGEIPTGDLLRDARPPAHQPIIRLFFRLSDSDRASISEITGGTNIDKAKLLEIRHFQNGAQQRVVHPEIERDPHRRRSAAALFLVTRSKEDWFDSLPANTFFDPPSLDRVETLLESIDQKLDPDDIEHLRQFAQALESVTDEEDSTSRELAAALADIAQEERTHPADDAAAVLAEELPNVVRFNEAARELPSQWDLRNAPPRGLANLLALAGLNRIAYIQAIDEGERALGTARKLREAAEAKLTTEFARWTQYPMTVQLEMHDSVLTVLVSNKDVDASTLSEHSEGLRQFVALVAMLGPYQGTAHPIVLVDEAETHLHYDAQADLMTVLAEQDAAAQIIYTTHSAGCLPEDFGAGIRIVEPDQTRHRSTIRNRFWTDEPSLYPLILGMGALTLAFFPLRAALLCEGGSDLVLLPTMLREVTGRRALGFQVVPGSANAATGRLADLHDEAPRTAWLVDGDRGGAGIIKKLHRAKVPDATIFAVGGPGSGLVIEDLLNVDVYVAAVNDCLGKDSAQLTTDDLASSDRPGALSRWCKAHRIKTPGKVQVANRVLDRRADGIVDPSHKTILRSLHSDLHKVLRPPG